MMHLRDLLLGRRRQFPSEALSYGGKKPLVLEALEGIARLPHVEDADSAALHLGGGVEDQSLGGSLSMPTLLLTAS